MQPTPLDPAQSAAQTLGRLGGLANTKRQNAARKRNAQQAGRPRRVCVFCGEPVVGGHADRHLDHTCGQHGWRWQKKQDSVVVTKADPSLLADVLHCLEAWDLPGARSAPAKLLARVRAAIAATGPR